MYDSGVVLYKDFLYVNQKSKMTTSTGNTFHIRYYSNCKLMMITWTTGKYEKNMHFIAHKRHRK
jgi:hypothetical protein